MTQSVAPLALEARGLAKSFQNGPTSVNVVRDLDISVRVGAFTLIKGPSGCGKSTLLAMLAGLTQPDSGVVTARDTSLWSLPTKARDAFRLAHMGFIFQGSILLPSLRAREQIAFVLREMGMPRHKADTMARSSLRDVGLGDRMEMLPAALSGGEKQRVAVACALAKRPSVIFADEPTSALDSENGQLVASRLRDLARQSGAAVVCVTHDDRLTPFADSILRMEDGRIIGTQTREIAPI
ncbi:ABC transporter ATP-binding protein [Parasulfitobacter algicola]|uniref:ABC transporter ATP-binding protein n=1 Tax=Parasulfitobacter algicola TaxID=2614809 RepID=A0ABX2ITS6_9RHOB|nr:ABC transporter ATP-binding protein [Sulfitobacter algicola]NSX55406.1 ABC transporter ATP-binding protein [Sulfitobacter algicola]